MKKSTLFFAALCCILSLLTTQKALAQYADYTGYKGVFYANKWYKDQSAFVGVVTYTFTNTEGNYSSLSGDVYIASKVPGVGTIKRIATSAFSGKKNGGMINVTLPSTIEVIEAFAFSNATKLYSIRLNEGLTSMQNDVFAGCTALTEVYIPSTLKEIPNWAFQGCTSLPAIALSAGIEHIGKDAFAGCTALQSVKSQGGANNVKTIGDYAFSRCSSLYDVRFSNGLTSIGIYAFKGCTKLENLTLPAKLATIGDFAFSNSGLKTLTVYMTTPININANVFTSVDLSQCTLYVPKGCKDAYKNANVWKKFGHILEIGETLTPDPEEETVEPVATGTKKIGDLWYDLHEDLTAKLLSRSDYKALTGAIKVPATVTFGKYTYIVNEMAAGVFYGCSNITSVTLPNTITEIPFNTFYNCTGLTNVTMPSALTSIGQSAFYGCTALTFVSLPASLTEIGANAFWGCDALTSVYIPAGIKTIKEYCFKSCDKLATVSLPEGLTEIETQAFIGCPALTTITLPASLAKMGDDVFSGKDMVSIRSLRETPPTATANTFRSMMNKATCILYVPFETKSKYEVATGWKDFTNIQEKGVTETIKYGKLFYKLREDFTAWVTYETTGTDNYKDLSGEITVEDKVIYQGAEYTVTNVGPSAFIKCKTITKVNLPASITEINSKAFEECTALEDVNIPYTVTYIPADAFDKSKLFTDNTGEDGAVYYNGCLLALTKQLPAAEYKVKEGTRMIATWVFENQDDLTAITLPDGLQVLCSSAISHMVNLKTLTLPASINFIGGGFCNDCFSLATIYNYSESPYDLSDNYCFDNINTAKCTLYVPKGSRTAYQSAAEWKNFPIYEMKGVYTVTFEDWNGQELKTEKVEEGNSASAPATPEREGYTFTGWDKDLTDIQSDLTVTAQYTVNTYTVRFIDPFDESIISQQTVEYGMSAVEPDASQRKEHEGYFFVDWESDFDIILSDKDVYAYYATVKYTVAFDKGNSIVDAYYVAHGETVDEVPAAEPFDCKTFVGWRSSLTGNLMTETEILSETVTEEVTYTADYEQDYYAITLVCSHGTVTCDEEVDLSHVACGTTIHFSFVPEEGYELAGWDNYDPATGYLVEHDDIIEALTQQKAAVYFTVTYFDWNMTILGTEKVEEGKDAKGLESDPEREGYTFTGWSSPLTNITSDLNVQAQYEKKEPTALDDTDQENPAARSTKQFRNGILYINRNGILYDAAGNQVQ